MIFRDSLDTQLGFSPLKLFGNVLLNGSKLLEQFYVPLKTDGTTLSVGCANWVLALLSF